MCGIYGISGFKSFDRATNIMQKMQELLHHRGPDAHGIWTETTSDVSLGHNRLSIIDLSDSATQPIYNEDDSLVLVFNGEIFNYKELREELIAKGHQFKSSSDSEVIIHLYEEEKENVVNRLRGMFAFAIYDKKNDELFIARDHFGIKPLYYTKQDDVFYFASELKALKESGASKLSLNEEAVKSHLSFLWCPFPATVAKDVFKLEPGTYIKVKKGEILEKVNYYDICFDGERSDVSVDDAIDQLDHLMEDSIKEQLVSDVPLGLFLSGGLDSSLIAAYVRKLNPNKPIKAFTIDIQGADMEGNPNDLPYARKVAKSLNIELEEIIVTPEDVLEYIEELTYILDEPLADPAAINVLLISKYAREKGFIVLLSGAGGDDVFSGYRRHKALEYDKKLDKVPKFAKAIASSVSKKLPVNNPKLRKARKFLEGVDLPMEERLIDYFYWLKNDEMESLFSDEFKLKTKNFQPGDRLKSSFENIPLENDPLNKMLYLESKFFLVDHNLNYTDKMGMYNSIETRVPFLDYRIVDWAAKLPTHYKLNNGETKWILKKVAERYLDDEIIYRKKTGFGAPLRQWIKEELDTLLNKYLNKEIMTKHGVFNYDAIQSLIKKNKEGTIDAAYTIFSILCITIWLEKMIYKPL
jgi:asparagine synthase (glutamine-hydrolysing)